MGRTLRSLSGLAAAFLLASVSTLGAPDAMRVHVIDVGQGAATLVEFPCAAILIDTGGERFPEDAPTATFDSTRELMGYLRKFFGTRPDLKNQLAQLVLSHPHPDHTRGVQDVIREFSPRSVVYNGQSTGAGIANQQFARNYAKEEGLPRWYVLEQKIDPNTGLTNEAIDPVECNPTNPVIRALWGQTMNDGTWDDDDFADENNHSVVLRIDYGQASILFTGDLEESTKTGFSAGIERLVEKYQGSNLLDVDVYHVGHHGSHNGTTPGLMKETSPQMALMSVGPACNRGGYSAWTHKHPRTVTVNDLDNAISGTRTPRTVRFFADYFVSAPTSRSMAKAIYATGWDGHVVVEGRADGSWSLVSTSGPPPCLK